MRTVVIPVMTHLEVQHSDGFTYQTQMCSTEFHELILKAADFLGTDLERILELLFAMQTVYYSDNSTIKIICKKKWRVPCDDLTP